MTQKQYALICSSTLTLAILIFLIQKDYIIINFKAWRQQSQPQSLATKQNISLIYWHHNKWLADQVLVLVTDNIPNTIQQVLSRWLQLIFEEKIVKKKVGLQAVLIDYERAILFVSFDRLPWNKESNTFDKWMAIEGILKTIKNAAPTLKKVHFLINHQPMNDTHLDFTNPWPVEGFLA